MIRLILQVFCAIFSGIIEATAISNEILPFGSPFLALFCLVPLYLAVARAKSYRESFWLFFIQTSVVHLISSFWLANFHDFAIFTLGASAAGTAVQAGFCGIVMHLLFSHASAAKSLEESGGRHPYASFLRIIWFASGWTLWEWVKSTGFLAYPWGTLSMAAYRWKIITQIASITGVWGITFIFSLFSAFCGEGILLLSTIRYSQSGRSVAGTYRQEGVFVLAIFCCTALYGIAEYFMPRNPVKQMNTVIVQQNIDPWAGGESTSLSISMRLTEQKVNELLDDGEKPDLVLWSEGVLSHPFPGNRHYYEFAPATESLSDFIRRMGVPFIMGGESVLNQYRRHYGNAAVFYDKNGDYSGFYCKMHLVPFAEVIPYADSPLMQQLLNKIVGFSSGWTPGNQYVLFQIPIQSMGSRPTPLEYRSDLYTTIPLNRDGISNPGVTDTFTFNNAVNPDTTVSFTTPICFEDAFPDVCSKLYRMGSEVFMNITNDSWSETNSSEYQHFIAASYLAIEYRTTLVRCANAGYSVVVDPSGRIIADLPVFTEGAIAAKVPIYKRTMTVYAQYGDWFAYICLAFVFILMMYYFWDIWLKHDDGPKFITITIGRRTPEIPCSASAQDDGDIPAAPSQLAGVSKPAELSKPAMKRTSPGKAAPAKRSTTAVAKKAPAVTKKAVSAKKVASAKKAARRTLRK